MLIYSKGTARDNKQVPNNILSWVKVMVHGKASSRVAVYCLKGSIDNDIHL